MYVVQQRSPDRVQCLQINILEARQEISKHVLFPMIFALEYIYAILYTYSVYCLQYDKLFKLVSSLDVSCSTPRQDKPYAYYLGVHYVQIPHCRPICVDLVMSTVYVCLRKRMQHGCSFRCPQ